MLCLLFWPSSYLGSMSILRLFWGPYASVFLWGLEWPDYKPLLRENHCHMEVAIIFPRQSSVGQLFQLPKPSLTSLFSESMVHHNPPSGSVATVSDQILLLCFSDYFKKRRDVISLFTRLFKDVLPFLSTRTNKVISVFSSANDKSILKNNYIIIVVTKINSSVQPTLKTNFFTITCIFLYMQRSIYFKCIYIYSAFIFEYYSVVCALIIPIFTCT